MKKQYKQNGITLVALVITIIILLILAGISISSLTNQGLFTQAENAKTASEIANIKEQIQLDIYEKQLEPPLGSIKEGELETILSSYGTVNKGEDGTIIGITTDKGYEILLSEIYSGTTTGEQNPTEKTPLEKAEAAKPNGSTITVTDASQGIVMIDSRNNEWVWIEVPKTVFKTATKADEYDKIKADLITYASIYREGKAGQGRYWTDEWYDGCGIADSSTYTETYNKMLSSVYTNGGFWISRYEIGDSTATASNTTRTNSSGTTGIAVSKADQIPYNYVTCSQAQAVASGMSTDTKKTSSLLFGIQWDLVCKYLEVNGNWDTTTNTASYYLNSNSTSWGNYNNSSLLLYRGKYNINPSSSTSAWTPYGTNTTNYVTSSKTSSNTSYYQLLTTGASEQTKKMNIYDFAGNEYEWTLEHATSNTDLPCAYRGGIYYYNGSYGPASYRYSVGTSFSYISIGFRSALY